MPPASCPPEAGKHYVVVWRLKRRVIFRDDRDRADCVRRAAAAPGVRQMAVLRGVLRGRGPLHGRQLDPERPARAALRQSSYLCSVVPVRFAAGRAQGSRLTPRLPALT
jgi:hypothetical protein